MPDQYPVSVRRRAYRDSPLTHKQEKHSRLMLLAYALNKSSDTTQFKRFLLFSKPSSCACSTGQMLSYPVVLFLFIICIEHLH